MRLRQPLSSLTSAARFSGGGDDRYSIFACAALLLVLFAAPVFFELGRGDFKNDEAIYNHAARSMVENDAWLSPWASPGSGPFLEKPPLKFWLIAGGIEWLGLPNDAVGYRFWDALFACGAFLYLFRLGTAVAGPICGLAAVAALFVNEALIFDHGIRNNNMEAPLLLAYCGGIWHWSRWMAAESRGRPCQAHLLAFSLWVVFGFLCKFVAALFLPLCAASTLALPQIRRRLWEDRRSVALSLVLFLALVSPWFIYQHLQRGAFFWQVILGEHVVQRFSTYLEPAHVQSAGFYWRELFSELWQAGTFGWTCAGAMLWLVATLQQRSSLGALVIVWAVLPLALISAGSSKLFHYAYPFLPPYALLAGFAFAKATQWISTGLFGSRRLGFVRLRKLLIVPALLALGYATHVQSRAPGYDRQAACSHRAHWASLGAAALLAPVPGIGPPLTVGAGMLWLLSKPTHAWCFVVRKTAHDPTFRRILADCVAQLPIDNEPARLYLYTYRTPPPNHRDFYYYQRAGGFQQTTRPQPSLLFFRLWVPGQQAVTIAQDDLWTQFLELRPSPELRQEVERVASQAGLEAEVAAAIHQLESEEEPAGFRFGRRSRVYLPGPFDACRQPLLEAGALPLAAGR
ncbi:MAG: hypothetical protein AAF657_09570 [Acidobacteriota bacterium]